MALKRIVALLMLCGAALAQKPESVTYKLNAEASVEYQNLIKQQGELVIKLNELERLRQELMIGAGIPAAERDRDATLDADGKTVVFPPKKVAAK